MTTTRQTHELAQVVARMRYVLLDFDGPVCKAFTDPTARTVTARLVEAIAAHGIDTPEQVEAGPHDVLHYARTVSAQLAQVVEGSLRALEAEAAATAAPTPGIDELFEACEQTGRTVAIVSNNAAEAVTSYLERTELTGFVTHIEVCDTSDPALMKPDPHLIIRTLRAINAAPEACTLVGDSESDIQAAHAAGVRSIGYANKSGKRHRLAGAGADAVTSDVTELARQLHDLSRDPSP